MHFFATGITRSYSFRRAQLLTLKAAVKRYEQRIIDALHKDLRKNSFEAYGTEIGFVYADISHTTTHLRQWMQPQSTYTYNVCTFFQFYIYRPTWNCINYKPMELPISANDGTPYRSNSRRQYCPA